MLTLMFTLLIEDDIFQFLELEIKITLKMDPTLQGYPIRIRL